MTAISASPLPCVPAPDPRPAAVRWHRPLMEYAGSPPLPLEDDPAIARATGSSGDGEQTGPAEDDPLRAHVQSLLSALIDAVQGRRPTAQLVRWVSDEVIADVAVRARAHQRTPTLLIVRSFRVQVPTSGVAEVSARLQAGERYAAVALRLERRGRRWFCSDADFGPLGPTAGSRSRLWDSWERDQHRP